MNKQQFMKAFGYRTVSLTNLLINGNFASTANWSVYTSSFSVSSNVAYTTATAIGGSIAQYNISVTNGYKCYCCAHILCQSTNEIFWINSQESDRIYLLPSGTGSFEYVSGIYTPNQTANAAFVAGFDSRSSGWTEKQMKYFSVIDLTAAFGAGKEPNKAQMDWLMQQFTNEYLDGTQNAKYFW